MVYVRDGTNLVTTVTAIFKTLIPQRKSITRLEKALWNKGLIFAVYESYIKPIKRIQLLCFTRVCYIFLFFATFFYIFSTAHVRHFAC